MERRERVTRVAIKQSQRVKPEELAGLDGRRQSSMGGTSRMNREIQVRICERLGVKFPGPTRPLIGWLTSSCRYALLNAETTILLAIPH